MRNCIWGWRGCDGVSDSRNHIATRDHDHGLDGGVAMYTAYSSDVRAVGGGGDSIDGKVGSADVNSYRFLSNVQRLQHCPILLVIIYVSIGKAPFCQ